MARSSHAPPLRPQDAPTLAWLARHPFLSARDLGILLEVEDASGVHRRLRRLAALGLVDHVVPSSDELQPQWLAYLTNAGLRQAAALEEQDPADLVWAWRCGEAGLLRRLLRLDHLVLTRGFLLDLLAALRAQHQSGLALRAQHPWPFSWWYVWRERRRALPLDGAGVISRPALGEASAWSSFFLLWEGDAHVALEAQRPRLRALLRAAQTFLWPWPGVAHVFPTVLLVAADAARATAVRSLLFELARAEEYLLPDLLTTDRVTLLDAGPLAAIWTDRAGRERALLDGLAVHRTPEQDPLCALEEPQDAEDGQEDDEDLEDDEPETPERARVLVRGAFTARAGAARVPYTVAERALVSLALRPREVRALQQIATGPLLTAAQLAELTGATALGIRRILTTLERHGVIDWDLPTRQEVRADRRYFLTPAGLQLLAARAGLAPRAYQAHTGSLAGELVARSPRPPAGAGAYPRKGTLRGTGLVWLQRYLEHTVALQEVYLAFVRAARAAHSAGRDEALELWRGEWALARRFELGGTWHTLRPDAAGRYRVGTETCTFFLELDRGTAVLGDVAEKLETYLAYRDRCAHDGVPVLGTRPFPILLMVTTGEERLRNLLDLQGEILLPLMRPLSLLVATAPDLAAHGPLFPIWRHSGTAPPRPLFPASSGSSR